jgi:hypothetical protein
MVVHWRDIGPFCGATKPVTEVTQWTEIFMPHRSHCILIARGSIHVQDTNVFRQEHMDGIQNHGRDTVLHVLVMVIVAGTAAAGQGCNSWDETSILEQMVCAAACTHLSVRPDELQL